MSELRSHEQVDQSRRKSGRGKRLGRGPTRCRAKFLRFFPGGFRDETYLDWERGYKEQAHERWQEQLGRAEKAWQKAEKQEKKEEAVAPGT